MSEIVYRELTALDDGQAKGMDMMQRTENGFRTSKRVGVEAGLRVAGTVATMAMGLMAAAAQAPVAVPVPFGSTIVGVAPGGSSTACSSTADIPTFNVSPGPFHYGDGCVGTQATLSAPYSASVDSLGNIYISDYSHFALRVLYNGGAALAAAIVAANPNVAGLVPQPGYMYTLAGGSREGSITKTGTTLAYYCNSNGSGPIGLNSSGNGCPGTEAEVKPRSAAVDANGNVFFPNISGGTQIKVFYVGGTAAANLIQLENPGVTPQPGYVYGVAGSGTQGYSGDGGLASSATVNSLRAVAVDANENLYIADGNTAGATTNNNIRKVTASTGIMTTLAGGGGCAYPVSGTTGCPAGAVGGVDGDGGPATSAMLNSPYGVVVDANGNVYVADATNGRIRAIYEGTGTLMNVSNPQTGYIYTVAGGGSTSAAAASASGTVATQLSFGTIQSEGLDTAGNLYLYDTTNKYVWRVDAKSGIATIVGGFGTSVAATAGNYCAGTTGPKSTDTAGDGCPATQAALNWTGWVSFDNQGNVYETESTAGVVRKFSFNTQFPATAVGSSTTQPIAFATVAAATATAENFTLETGADGEFTDAGGDTCSLNTAIAADKTCVFNVAFTPSEAGLRQGSVAFAGTPIAELVAGVGKAANVSIDPGTQSTIGTGLKPGGVGTDLNGNLYIADAKSNSVLKVAASGGTPATLMTGLSNPAQVAVDGAGNVYVADTGNNRIAVKSAGGGAITSLGSGLSGPTGVAVDSVGNVNIADTGNNRVVRIFATGGQQTLNLTGLSAPTGLALDNTGDLFVADSGNSRVVELGASTGQATINLGTSSFKPSGVAVDAAGDLYVTDATNLQVVTYLSGSTNGNPILTGLTSPVGIGVDVNGSVYVADSGATGVVALNRAMGNINGYPVTNLGQVNGEPITFTNTGNQPLIFTGTNYATNVTAPYSLQTASSNGCVLGAGNPVGPATACLITANFSPTVVGTYNDTIVPATNAANNGGTSAVLSGLAVHLTPSSTTLTVTSPTTSSYYYGQTLTITATTTLNANVGVPLGNFIFTVDGRQQPAISFGATTTSTTQLTATITLTGLTVGSHSVSVNEIFTAPPYLYASSGATLNFSVLKAITTTTLAALPSSSGAVVTTTFTATVIPTTGLGETGTVNFYAGTSAATGTLLNPAPIAINSTTGIASYVSPATVFPSGSFIAVYTGDSNFSGSTSTTLVPSGNFNLTTPATVVDIPQGGNITNSIALTPYFGYSGTVTPTCSGLPKYAICSFQPVTAAVSGTAQVQFTIYIYTSTSVTSKNEMPESASRVALAMLSPFGVLALAFARRRRWVGRGALVLLAVMVSLGAMTSMTGCTNPVAFANPSAITPASTQTVTVTMSDNNTPQVSRSVGFTLNVCNSTVGATCQTF